MPGVSDADHLIEHPVPDVDTARAEVTARRLFGIDGNASPLVSERDRNFLIESDQGAFTLKFANPAEGPEVLALQAAGLDHIARVDPGLPVPRNRPTVAGDPIGSAEVDGITLALRMVTFLPGSTIELGVSSEPLRRSVSAVLARMGFALRGLFDPAAGRQLLWDLTHLLSLRSKLHFLPSEQRPAVERCFDTFEEVVAPRLPHLRAQIIHNDFNPDNMLVDPEYPDRLSGIIDFGDMVHAPLIIDLAVAAGYQILGQENPVEIFAGMASAYHAVCPLEAEEVDVLPILAVSRLAQSLVIGEWRAQLHPDNTEYILGYHPQIWETMQRLNDLDLPALGGAVREACGIPTISKDRRSDLPSLLERRRLRLGSGMRLSYSEPLHLVAGEGVWLIDSEGHRHLDAYNNVPHVGHSHPTVTAAIARQTATLNTNTRYLVEEVLDYADRLVELLPGDLNVVMFTNSGSEANDLAWRMAQTVTARRGMIVTRHAYHGSTALTMATSPEEIGNGTLEPWWRRCRRRTGAFPSTASSSRPFSILQVMGIARPHWRSTRCSPATGSSSLPTDTSGLPLRWFESRVDSSSPTRFRPGSAGSVPACGVSQTMISYLTSSLWASRWETGIRSPPWSRPLLSPKSSPGWATTSAPSQETRFRPRRPWPCSTSWKPSIYPPGQRELARTCEPAYGNWRKLIYRFPTFAGLVCSPASSYRRAANPIRRGPA